MAGTWWQHGIIYQVYPRSFKDSNGDGVGDLRGIITELDYLAWLGVDAIWISPFYPSPMVDFGYDVSNYTGVDPLFGDLATFDEMLRQAHRRDLNIIIDFVINHTSDRHPWFLEAPPPGNPPNETGISGRMPGPMALHPTTGSASSAGRPGSGTLRQASITCTRLTGGSQTSTGATSQ